MLPRMFESSTRTLTHQSSNGPSFRESFKESFVTSITTFNITADINLFHSQSQWCYDRRKMLITSLLFTLSSAHSTRCDRTRDQQEEEVQASCQFTDEDPHRFFGTKTTYTNAFNHLKTNAKNVSIPESCSPVMVYVFKRHAIRYPERNDILVMNKVLGDIRDYILDAATTGSVNMCQKDIESLQNWTLNMKPEDDNSITESGFKETESIGKWPSDVNVDSLICNWITAKRLRERYYRLFDPKLRIFDVTVSKRKRTSETAHSFLDEIKRFYGYKGRQLLTLAVIKFSTNFLEYFRSVQS